MGSRPSISGAQALVQARGLLGSEGRRVPQSRAYLGGWREMQTGERAIEHPRGGEAGHQGSTMAECGVWVTCRHSFQLRVLIIVPELVNCSE